MFLYKSTVEQTYSLVTGAYYIDIETGSHDPETWNGTRSYKVSTG